MNLGMNIQKYRKELKISQEELGQKLFVSRQTISLWEKGQTVPTIENLVRLGEIFSVTVDEILNGERKIVEPLAIDAKEVYGVSFSKDELSEIKRLQRAAVYKRPIRFFAAGLFLALIAFASDLDRAVVAFFAGWLAVGLISHIKGIAAYKKAWRATALKLEDRSYIHEIYEGYMIIRVCKGAEQLKQFKFYFEDIEKMELLGDFILLQSDGMVFIIRKSDLKESSFYYSYMYNNPQKIKKHEPYSKWKTVSVVLWVLSLLALFVPAYVLDFTARSTGQILDNMWLFFAFTPIPLASIVFGIIAKLRGKRCKGNIIIGAVITVLLCAYGVMGLIF